MDLAISIEPMLVDHWPSVQSIYLEGIATGNATFQTTAPDWADWNERHLLACRFVAKAEREVLGWAALTPYSKRPVYVGVAEVSIYVTEAARGRGIGRMLLSRLVTESEAQGIWTLQAGIFPENSASLQLHKNAGFRIVGTRERIGRLNGRWRDTLLLERRSAVAGS